MQTTSAWRWRCWLISWLEQTGAGRDVRRPDRPPALHRASAGRPGAFVLGQQGDPAGVPFVAAERGGEEDPDEPEGLLLGVHPGADRDHVRVVVLPGQACRVGVVGERGAGARHLGGVGWVVVLGRVALGAVVHHVVPVGGQGRHEVVLQLEPGVVGTDVYAHGSTIAERLPLDALPTPGATGRRPGTYDLFSREDAVIP